MSIHPSTETLKERFEKWFEKNRKALQNICEKRKNREVTSYEENFAVVALLADGLSAFFVGIPINTALLTTIFIAEKFLDRLCYADTDRNFSSTKIPNLKLENFLIIIKTVAIVITFVVFLLIVIGVSLSYGSTKIIIGLLFFALLIGFTAVAKNIWNYFPTFKNLSLPVLLRYKFLERDKSFTFVPSTDEVSKAYTDLTYGEQTTDQDIAIKHYRSALEILTPELFPRYCRQAAYNLGVIFYNKGDCVQARHAFETAHQALDNLRHEMNLDTSKQRLAMENIELYARLVCCCLDKKDKAAAFRYASAAKGRAFVDALNRVNFDIGLATRQTEDWSKYTQLTQVIDYYRNTPKFEDEIKGLLEKENALWNNLTREHPTLTATQNAPALTIEQAHALAEDMDATLVEYYQHDKGWSAFVITDKIVEHVPLPLVNDNLFEEMKKWIGLIENKESIGYSQIRTHRTLSKWHKAIIAPLQMYLPKSGKIVFAPFEKLHLFPVHIAFDSYTEHYLAQDYSISFIPSLSVLHMSLGQTQKKQHQFIQFQRFLNVAHPGVLNSREYDYLQGAIPAAKEIADTFTKIEVTPLYEDKATPDAFITHASGQDIIHFFGHGDFVPEHPEKSGLMLAKGWLTVQDIIAKLDLGQVRLTTLGACKTVWLTQALMTAKTQIVVTTLWNVDQDATVALFKTFYKELAKGCDPVEALNIATHAIRERTEWQHPYYWAAFQISGLAYHFPNTRNGE